MPQFSKVRPIAVVLTAVLCLSACGVFGKGSSTTSPSPSGAAPSDATVSTSPTSSAGNVLWSSCNELGESITGPRTNGFDFTCTKLPVPVDYSKPDGAQTNVFVVRMHPREQQPGDRIGSLVFNPGGPGVSGVTLGLSYVTLLPDDILKHFDFVTFDPRGIGLSNPISCVSDKKKDQLTGLNPDVRTAAGRTQQKAASRDLGSACVRAYGNALAQYNTVNTARDLDRIRDAVGDEKLTYLGYSYGTVLGAQYAHLFPKKLRAAVLDGAVDPQANGLQWAQMQAAGFEREYAQFTTWCAKNAPCSSLGDAKKYILSLAKRADRTPLHSLKSGETRVATSAYVIGAALAAMYDKASWPRLATALVAAKEHADAAGLFQLTDEITDRDSTGHYSNVLEAYTAYTCNDLPLHVSDAVVAAKATEWTRTYPVFGGSFAAALYACASWPATRPALELPYAPTAARSLVIGTTRDPATPYAGAASLVRTLGSAVELTWDGDRHTAYPKTACVDSAVDAYLIDLTVPAVRSCPTG